jgi:hypothetical protein
MDECSCVTCRVCDGAGWYDELGDIVCDYCGGDGLEIVCDACLEREMEEVTHDPNDAG